MTHRPVLPATLSHYMYQQALQAGLQENQQLRADFHLNPTVALGY
ncbi:hypothetical protein EI42_01306 [Thermosporothrix hazakensis]|jgi:hypothetical protein|uniref:Uncharacterized protein n=1 Tax=Thermosporothrix hazakensis TaxID=644383 RepID=A0A326UCW4_THEHA|nr:hypothetical protein EI42_01306 [Thermosporothrix hazakensis]GCE45981.1 hypothetical protein KTH_08500 [Thermosporothrix hazakensis]